MGEQRRKVSAALFAGGYLAALASAFTSWIPSEVPILLLACYLVLEAPKIRPTQAVAGGLLLVAGGLLAFLGSHDPLALASALGSALAHTLPLMLLFGAMLWLHHAVSADRSFIALGEGVAALPPSSRFLTFALSGHILGGVLSLAGLQFILSANGRLEGGADKRTITLTAARGFNLAACWSPFFVGMAAALAAVPANWSDVATVGIGLAVLLLGFSWLWERSFVARPPARASASPGSPGTSTLGRHAPGVAGAILFFGIPVVALHEAGGLSMPVAIALAAPLLALIWRRARVGMLQRLPGAVYAGFPDLRSEMFILLAANVFATGLLVHDAAVLSWLDSLAGSLLTGAWGPGALILAGTALAALGVHPIVIITFVGGALSEGLPGGPSYVTTLALAIVWGLGTMASPISAVNIMLAKATGASSFRIAWAWNGGFSLAAAMVAAAALGLMAELDLLEGGV